MQTWHNTSTTNKRLAQQVSVRRSIIQRPYGKAKRYSGDWEGTRATVCVLRVWELGGASGASTCTYTTTTHLELLVCSGGSSGSTLVPVGHDRGLRGTRRLHRNAPRGPRHQVPARVAAEPNLTAIEGTFEWVMLPQTQRGFKEDAVSPTE